MEDILQVFASMRLKGDYSIGLLDQKHIQIRLHNEEDFTRIWLRSLWFIKSFPMRGFKWSPDFRSNVESQIVPLWISLPYLPVHFYDKSCLFSIAKAIGTPLKIDEPTASLTRPSVARVCRSFFAFRSSTKHRMIAFY